MRSSIIRKGCSVLTLPQAMHSLSSGLTYPASCLKYVTASIGLPKKTTRPPLSITISRSNSLKISLDGWWIFAITNLPFKHCLLSKYITFSESADERPEVGSSANKMAGSRISSRAMLRRFRCPPLNIFLSGLPTTKSRASTKSKSTSDCSIISSISLSVMLPKQKRALNSRF